jgi:putative Holliday junction resolvase
VSVLALDFGERRIGVAASDADASTASPIAVIERRSLAEDIDRIRDLIRRKGAQSVVVGLPLNMDGSPGPPARRVRRFASALRRELGLEVRLWDERLSTAEAERALISTGKKRARRREVRDAVAAALILQSYLDARRVDSGNETVA